MTPEEHNKYISWTFLANGLFQAAMLLLVFGFFILYFAFGGPPDDKFPAGLFAVFFSFILLINLALISPNFIAYHGLKNRKSWARVATSARLSADRVAAHGLCWGEYTFRNTWRRLLPRG